MGFKMNLFIVTTISLCFSLSKVFGRVCHEVCEEEENSTSITHSTDRLLKLMKTLDDKYENVLKPLAELDESNINGKIRDAFISYGGIVDNQLKVPNKRYQVKVVPSFLRLGDYHMIDLASTTVFFHELQTTADTIFELVNLESIFHQFHQKVTLNLNNLEVTGLAEFVQKGGTPDNLHFTYKDDSSLTSIKFTKVKFEAELRLRVSGNTLRVEDVVSSLTPDKITVTFKFNSTEQIVHLESTHAGCLIRALNDLCGRWLVKYMNTILDEHIDLPRIMSTQLDELRKYFYERTQILNSFLDPKMGNVEGVMKPFVLSTPYGVILSFSKGTYHDMSSLYREKPTTGVFYGDGDETGYTAAVLSGRFRFSRLKLFLNYNAIVPQMSVPLQGVVVVEEDQAYMDMDLKVHQDKVEWLFKNSYPAEIHGHFSKMPILSSCSGNGDEYLFCNALPNTSQMCLIEFVSGECDGHIAFIRTSLKYCLTKFAA